MGDRALELFYLAQHIIKTLKQNNYEAYFVGGSVRDYLLKRNIGDIDITTNALPKTIQALFPRHVDVGVEHGTIVVLMNNESFEVTTYRTETTYSDHRRPDNVQFTTSLNNDLARRDFTMNAIAMDDNFEIYDPYHGKEAIENKEIITVGNPYERFNEDALRMLRAIRFMSQLDFVLNHATFNAIKNQSDKVSYVSIERIVQELKKLYSGVNVKKAKHTFLDSNIYAYIPFFNTLDKNNIYKSNVFSLENEIIVQLIIDNKNQFINTLKLSNNEINKIHRSILLYNDLTNKINPKIIAYQYDYNLLTNMVKILENNDFLNPNILAHLQSTLEEKPQLPISSRKDLNVNGKVLMEVLNKPGGPWLKELLNNIETEIILKRLENNQHQILKWVQDAKH